MVKTSTKVPTISPIKLKNVFRIAGAVQKTQGQSGRRLSTHAVTDSRIHRPLSRAVFFHRASRCPFHRVDR